MHWLADAAAAKARAKHLRDALDAFAIEHGSLDDPQIAIPEKTSGDHGGGLRYASVVAVPKQLMDQLLALDEPVRLEIAHQLMESVDGWVDDDIPAEERERLHAALNRSLAQAEAGQTVPAEQVFAELRARRAARAAR